MLPALWMNALIASPVRLDALVGPQVEHRSIPAGLPPVAGDHQLGDHRVA